MRVLKRKLVRDLWRQKIQASTIILILACGVSSQVTSLSLIATLNAAMDRYYQSQGFPDLFAKLQPVPLAVVGRLHSISGVSTIQPRIVFDASLQFKDEENDAVLAKLIGVPEEFEANLNRVVLRKGELPSKLRKNQAIVSEVFAEARGIQIGTTVFANVGGHPLELQICGIGISPEYLFQIREGAGVPDNERFGLLWMNYQDLAVATKMEGACNEILFDVQNTAGQNFVIERIKRLMKPWGIRSVFDRSQQDSHRYTTNAIRQLKSIAVVPPAIFLAVASFLIYISTARLLKTEREQIAMLRAFGYSVLEVGAHYLSYTLILVLLGWLLGLVWGVLLAGSASSTYGSIYRFPDLPLRLDMNSLVISIFAACFSGLLGGAYSVWKAARLEPSLGLRPEPPASYRLTWIDRIAFHLNLPPLTRMLIRGLGRWPIRTSLGIVGISLGISVMILGGYTQGAIANVIDFEFFMTRRYDVLVQFVEGTPASAAEEIRRIPGVIQCEAFSTGRCNFGVGHRQRTVHLFGIDPSSSMIVPVTESMAPVQLHGNGIAVSSALAKSLEIHPGSSIELEFQNGNHKRVDAVAESLITDYAGLNAYVTQECFQKWSGKSDQISGVVLQIDLEKSQAILAELQRRPRIVATTFKNKSLENFRSSEAKNLLLFRVFNMLFSGVIAVGAVLSFASISYVEKLRDLSTLRAIGYSAVEVGWVLIGELLVMGILAIPIGCAGGYFFAWIATFMLNSETQRIPFLVDPATYANSIFVSITSGTAAGLSIQLWVNRMDFVTLLKSKE